MSTDLQSCDQEPIRIPGHIQPQGFLLSIDRKSTELLRISANVGEFVDVDPLALLGKTLEAAGLLTPALLKEVLSREPKAQMPRTHGITQFKSGSFLVISHLSGDERVIEFEFVDPAFEGSLDLLYPDMRAAVETLRKMKLYDALLPKIVKGASITQAYQYVATGAAEVGFVAQSQVIAEQGGSRWVVPKAFHSPIDQQAILLKTGENNAAARAFLAFLKTPKAAAIIKRYGYEVRP
jgi:light-regulated signal transduction histidine kinase (bacteriophytochrome)